MGVKKFEIIDHTADIGITAFGSTAVELFKNAACGMFKLMIRCKSVQKYGSEKISINAVDENQLLVKWLQELLFIFEARHLFPVEYEISKISKNILSGEVKFSKIDFGTCETMHQIKAVTYHNLAIKKVGGHLQATVIFDV